MSAARKDTPAARAALARRRQRGTGTFTPALTSADTQRTRSTNKQPSMVPPASAVRVSSGGDHKTSSESTKDRPQRASKTLTENGHSSQQAAHTTSTSRYSSSGVDRHMTVLPTNGTATKPLAKAVSVPAVQKTTSVPTRHHSEPTNGSHHSPARKDASRTRSMDFKSTNGHSSQKQLPTSVDENDELKEDEQFIEEPEPLVETEVVDAKCLTYGSSVTVRSHANVRATMDVSKQSVARNLVTMDEQSLHHVFEISRGDDSAENDTVVRYGDIIALRTQDCFLGVSGVTLDLGFFCSTVGPAEQWTVLHGERVVLVGSAALQKATKGKGKTAAVQSGDPLLLRNCSTGGLLSLDSTGELTLVTDSYDAGVVPKNVPSLDRVQHHDRIFPSCREMFQLVNSEVPPCPQWAERPNQRTYDGVQYLLETGRNDRDDTAKLELFGPSPKDSRKSLREPLDTGNVALQEKILLDEVIGSMFGLEGQYIKVVDTGGNLQFQISEPQGSSFDASLRNLVNRILPLSTAYIRVRSFISSHCPGYEYGLVVQAACESVDALLKENLEFAVSMENMQRQGINHESMTMSTLNVHVQGPLRRMTILEQVVVAMRAHKGGSLLNALHELQTRVFTGDNVAQKVLSILLERASVPYFEMLEAWLETGVLDDPYEEFMIELVDEQPVDEPFASSFVNCNGDAWNDMFRIRNEHVLEDLMASPVVIQQVLLTGKYWNGVQLCWQSNEAELDWQQPTEEQNTPILCYGMDATSMSIFVHNMYKSASQKLLQLLMGDFNIVETLRTMKRYFLLNQGDFPVYLFDAAEDDLQRELPEVSQGRVQHLLSMCIQLTEPHVEEVASSALLRSWPSGPLTAQMLKCLFASESLTDRLDALHAENGGIDAHDPKTPSRHPYGMTDKGITGVEAFMMDFARIPFPTSLVISRHSLSSYQLLFRHLFFAKHVERRLNGVWLDHQVMKHFQSLQQAMGPSYFLRQRMLHFMQNLIHYMMFEVIEPSWIKLDAAIRKQQHESSRALQTVDDIIKVHEKFLEHSLSGCLLTHRDLIRSLTKLMKTCLLFSDQLKRFMEKTKIGDESKAVANQKRSAVQRNLNDPFNASRLSNKKALRKSMATESEERSLRLKKQAARVERELSNESYKRMIARFDEVFNEGLFEFMSQLLSESSEEHHSQKTNLCIRLDYNGYVTRQMGLR